MSIESLPFVRKRIHYRYFKSPLILFFIADTYSAYQSSMETRWNGLASYAVDGDMDGNYWHESCTHTKLERQPWWYVDMNQKKNVKAVKITNRADCCCKYGAGVFRTRAKLLLPSGENK